MQMQVRCVGFVLKLVESCSNSKMAAMAEVFTIVGNALWGVISVMSFVLAFSSSPSMFVSAIAVFFRKSGVVGTCNCARALEQCDFAFVQLHFDPRDL